MGRPRKADPVRPLQKDHHGTASCYVMNKCRCDPCTRAASRGNKARALRGPNLVDAGPVKEHILYLGEHGVGRSRIGQLIGTTKADVQAILTRQRIRPDKAAAILAIRPEAAATLVDATGTHRRLQALVAIGWSNTDLGKHLGYTRNAIASYLRQDRVHWSTAKTVTALYDKLAMTPGPTAKARALAARRGWLPPLAWDDDTIDDPTFTPGSVRRDQREAHALNIDDVLELITNGVRDLDAIARRLDAHPDSVLRTLRTWLAQHQDRLDTDRVVAFAEGIGIAFDGMGARTVPVIAKVAYLLATGTPTKAAA